MMNCLVNFACETMARRLGYTDSKGTREKQELKTCRLHLRKRVSLHELSPRWRPETTFALFTAPPSNLFQVQQRSSAPCKAIEVVHFVIFSSAVDY